VATVVRSFNCGLGSVHDDDSLGGAAGSGRAPVASWWTPADGPAPDAALDPLPAPDTAPEAAEGCIGIPIEPVGAMVGAIRIEPVGAMVGAIRIEPVGAMVGAIRIEPVGAMVGAIPIEPVGARSKNERGASDTACSPAASTPLLPLL
jgi:hypothetical protein